MACGVLNNRLGQCDLHLDSEASPAISQGRERKSVAKVYQIKSSRELSLSREAQSAPYRDAVCGLCEKIVSLHLDVPLAQIRARTRKHADIALARQIAMYLAHTTFSLPLTEVGLYFGRDRTTVTHACTVVENRRDEMSFEVTISQLESILQEVRCAVDIAVLDRNGSVQFPEEC